MKKLNEPSTKWIGIEVFVLGGAIIYVYYRYTFTDVSVDDRATVSVKKERSFE